MKNLNLKNLAVLVLVFALLLMTTACGAGQTVSDASSDTQPSQTANGTSGPAAEPQSFRIGICNYVDDASLNQIVENIQARLEEISAEKGVQFVIDYDNCNADATVMEQIIANFQSSGTDLLVGVATPVAMRMQTATEDSQTPVVFAAVSDPVGAGLGLTVARGIEFIADTAVQAHLQPRDLLAGERLADGYIAQILVEIGYGLGRPVDLVDVHSGVGLVDEDIHLLGLVGANPEMLLTVLVYRARIQKAIGLDIAVLVDHDDTQGLHTFGFGGRRLVRRIAVGTRGTHGPGGIGQRHADIQIHPDLLLGCG